MQEQAIIAGRQANIAEKQMLITGHQTDIIEKQKEIARLGHLATHRPKLRVRNVKVTAPSDFGRLLFSSDRITGQCYVANIGASDAKVVEAHVGVFALQDGLPMERPYEGKEPNNPISGVIAPGASLPLLFDCLSPFAGEEASRALQGGMPTYIMGWISYADGTGVTRRTAFCRRWDAQHKRFTRDDDPDYEYEE